jgi:hypothetical protein
MIRDRPTLSCPARGLVESPSRIPNEHANRFGDVLPEATLSRRS